MTTSPQQTYYVRKTNVRRNDDDSFFLACEDFGGRFDDSLPAYAFFFRAEIILRTLLPPFGARISPQWLSELKRLWLSIPLGAALELVSLIGSDTMFRKHSQLTPT